MEFITFFLLIVTIVCVCYYFKRTRYAYWENRGIPFVKGTFPLGCLKGVGTTNHIAEILARYYNQMKKKTPFCGIFMFIRPALLVLDLDLVKTILVKDFQYFMNRGLYYNKKDDPLSVHLLHIEGSKWKNLRAKLTPTFTSGKMKMMFPTIVTVAEEFEKCVSKTIEDEPQLDVKDIVARFTTDVIGNCAFGLKCNSLIDPDAKFRVMGRKIFESSRFKIIKFIFMSNFKKIANKLHMKLTDNDVSEFFLKAVKDTVEYRETNNIKGNDFMNLLIQLKNHGKLEDDTTADLLSLTVEEIAAQCFIFFAAGFETSATTMSFTLYELSINQHIQEKARQEFRAVLDKHNGKITYESLNEMQYIHQIINETLRKYPPIGNLLRRVTKDYKIPDTNYVLKEGITVVIPVYGIQHDPDIYPNPEEFNPENFSEENVRNRSPYAFLPFGEGPRNCIGLRFGIMQIKIALATLLLNFKFTTCSKTIVPLKISKKDFILSPQGKLYLNVVKINH